jgi:hypothetical protein
VERIIPGVGVAREESRSVEPKEKGAR